MLRGRPQQISCLQCLEKGTLCHRKTSVTKSCEACRSNCSLESCDHRCRHNCSLIHSGVAEFLSTKRVEICHGCEREEITVSCGICGVRSFCKNCSNKSSPEVCWHCKGIEYKCPCFPRTLKALIRNCVLPRRPPMDISVRLHLLLSLYIYKWRENLIDGGKLIHFLSTSWEGGVPAALVYLWKLHIWM